MLVDRFGYDKAAVARGEYEQWWPARAISIEEYLDYYSATLQRFRPKIDNVAVVFLRPWWSEFIAEAQGG